MSLCPACIKSREETVNKVTAAGGWCAPTEHGYSFDEPGCYIIESRPYTDFLPTDKKVNRKRAIKAFNRWRRNEAQAGQMIHGAYVGINLFPEMSVARGGITYAAYQREK